MKLLTADQLIQAAYLCGQGKTVKEVCEAVGASDPAGLRQSLFLYGINFAPKPFGHREISVRVSPDQHGLLERAAEARGILGMDKAQAMLTVAVRGLLESETILDNVISDEVETPRPARPARRRA